jgi:hypothetical protein
MADHDYTGTKKADALAPPPPLPSLAEIRTQLPQETAKLHLNRSLRKKIRRDK